MSTPTTPGLYLDAAGEVWRVTTSAQPCPTVTFDELLEQAITPPADQAARSGPFTPLLTLTPDRIDILSRALDEYRLWLDEPHVPVDHDTVQAVSALADLIRGHS